MTKLLMVGLGGFVGSVLRYLISGWVQHGSGSISFPFGTMAVNITGCLFIGFLGGLADYREVFTPATRLFVMVGILGGFTTFSTFGYETLTLMRDAQMFWALMNVLLQVIFGVTAAFAGYALAGYLYG